MVNLIQNQVVNLFRIYTLKDLAVVLFVSSVDDAIMSIKEVSIFDDSQIKTESNL